MTQPVDLTERTLSRKDLYDGLLCRVHVDEVLLPNGHTSQREVVDHVDGVAVLPLRMAADALEKGQRADRDPVPLCFRQAPAGDPCR